MLRRISSIRMSWWFPCPIQIKFSFFFLFSISWNECQSIVCPPFVITAHIWQARLVHTHPVRSAERSSNGISKNDARGSPSYSAHFHMSFGHVSFHLRPHLRTPDSHLTHTPHPTLFPLPVSSLFPPFPLLSPRTFPRSLPTHPVSHPSPISA